MRKNLIAMSGPLGILILWAGISTAMRRAHFGIFDSRPLSYLGTAKPTDKLFSITLLTSAVLFIIYSLYVRRAFGVRNKFLVIFLVGQIGQIIAAITPYGHRQPYKLIHTIAAFTLAFSLPLLISQFAHSQMSSYYYPYYRLLLRLEQVTFLVGMGLFIFVHGIAPLGEALPAIGFHIWIIMTVIISVSSRRVKDHSNSH